jgi:hypothetical protein
LLLDGRNGFQLADDVLDACLEHLDGIAVQACLQA